MKYEKLSEKNLKDVLNHIFPGITISHQYRLDKFRIDYYLEFNNRKMAFEFDGPTHYTQSKTQWRDIKVKNILKDMNIDLIRIPYFVQINSENIEVFLGHEFCKDNGLFEIKLESEYKNGFWDKKCLLPGDFNQHGWKLFFSFYENLISTEHRSMAKEIYESLFLGNHSLTTEEILGVDYLTDMDKTYFGTHYPT